MLTRLCVTAAMVVACGAMPAAATAAVVSGTGSQPIFTAGAGEVNNLRLTVDGVTTRFDDDVPVTTTSPDCAATLGNVSCTPSFVIAPFHVTIHLLDGDDQTTIGPGLLQFTQYGGEGDDHLHGNPNGLGYMHGGKGNDSLYGGAGTNLTGSTAMPATTP